MYWYMYLLYSIVGILGICTVILLVTIIYLKLTIGKCKSKVNLRGKTAIVTGATSGIGYETALDFAKRDAKVILACRNPKTGKETEERIIKETKNANIFFKQLDQASFKSVRKFAEEINKSEERLDILVNNAGAYGLSETTEDGLMLLMQTNYFSPVLLTMLLLDLMKRTSNSRIVNVASGVANYAKRLEINKLNDYPSGVMRDGIVYTRSKLCNILFTIKLAEKLVGTSVTTYSVHPGVVLTEINRKYVASTLKTMIALCFVKTPRQGAQTTIYCSVAAGIENLSGQHFHDCHVVRRYKRARDPDTIDKLWHVTENTLNLV